MSLVALLDHGSIYRSHLVKHDDARDSYRLSSIHAATGDAFDKTITDYVQHHLRHVTRNEPDTTTAFALARDVLSEYGRGRLDQDGYAAARAGTVPGGLPDALNAICRGLRTRALHEHVRHLYATHVDTSSTATTQTAAQSFVNDCGPFIESVSTFSLFWSCFPPDVRRTVPLPAQRPTLTGY